VVQFEGAKKLIGAKKFNRISGRKKRGRSKLSFPFPVFILSILIESSSD
jgi:hypothetical protein